MIGSTNTQEANINYNNLFKNCKIRVIDYDGSIIDEKISYTNQEYTLPVLPVHNNLIFQEWTGRDTVTNNKIFVGDGSILVSPIYTTASGQNEFDIELTTLTGLSVALNMNGTKDWGDGTTDTNTSHTYANYGKYTIKCNGNTMNSGYFGGLFGQYPNGVQNYNYYVKNVRLSNVTSITQYAFQYCKNLQSISIPNTVTSIAKNAFQQCCSLQSISIPNTVTSIAEQAFSQCRSLSFAILPNSITSITSSCFYGCCRLQYIIISDNITSILSSAFAECSSNIEYDFTQNTQIPTLANSSSLNYLTKIIVPWNLYNDWKAASNWSSYANYITVANPVTINFINNNTSTIYVNGNPIYNNTIKYIGSSITYYCYDGSNNILLLPQTVTGITEGSIQNIDLSLSSKKKITLETGVTGLDVTFTIDGTTYKSSTDNNGDYYIYTIGTGTLNYFIDGGIDYNNQEGTIELNNSNITINITLSPSIWIAWTRPNLTSNGTLGGNNFAVYASSEYSSYYSAYRAVDDTSTYWMNDYNAPSNVNYVFYNPDMLKVTQLIITYKDSYYIPVGLEIQASVDNVNWQNISSTYEFDSENKIGTVTLDNMSPYNYYKIIFTKNRTYIQITNLDIIATCKEP